MFIHSTLPLLLSLGLWALACSNTQKSRDAKPGASETREMQEWTILLKGSQCTIEKQQGMLLKNQAEYDAAWQQIFEGIDYSPAMPEIDFGQKSLLFGFAGVVSRAGHDLDIDSILVQDNRTSIYFRHTQPGSNCISAAVVEYPFLLATIPKQQETEITYHFDAVNKACK